MQTTIQSIRKYGGRYQVNLACGHHTSISADELKNTQAYIGRIVNCLQPHPEDNPNQKDNQ
jgi:hypothetical protein